MTYKLQWIIIIASLLMTKVASATEFNINAIDKDQRGSVDLSLFKDQISVTPGSYFVTVAVNDIPLANGWQLRWREINNAVQVCIPPELVDTFALQDDVRHALPEKEGCVDFAARPDIKFTFEQGSQTLKVTIPVRGCNTVRLTGCRHPPGTSACRAYCWITIFLPAIISPIAAATMTTPIPMAPPVRTWARGGYAAITSTRKAILTQARSIMDVFHACICSALCPRSVRN